MKNKWILVPALPSLTQADWNTCFNRLEKPVYEIPCSLTPTEKVLLAMLEAEWLIVFHWVIKKKWIKKHKIPIKPKLAKLFEPKGTYWYWILELCLQLHATQWGNAYDNAGHWYVCLANERKSVDVEAFNSILQYYKSGKDQDLKKADESEKVWLGKKSSVIESERQFIGALRRGTNLLHPHSYPHHYRLVEAALELKDKSDIFRVKFWNEFLSAYSKWINSLREKTKSHEQNTKSHEPYFASCYAVGQNILVQQGKGKYTRPIEMPSDLEYKRPSFFVIPEALPSKAFSD